MSLCEHCKSQNFKSCDLKRQFETEVTLMETRTTIKSEDPDRVPEMEEVQLTTAISELKMQLKTTALERGCTEFK